MPGVADGVYGSAVRERFDGSLSSRVTRTTPALVHYNGPSRENWERWQSPGARLAKLQDAFVTNSGARSDAEADAAVERFVRERVAFLGPDLVRRREVGLAAVCAGGGRLSKRFHEKYNKEEPAVFKYNACAPPPPLNPTAGTRPGGRAAASRWSG